MVGPKKLINKFSEGQITLHNITDIVTRTAYFHLRDVEKLDVLSNKDYSCIILVCYF